MRIMYMSGNYNAHTSSIFKRPKLLKIEDIILGEVIYMHYIT